MKCLYTFLLLCLLISFTLPVYATGGCGNNDPYYTHNYRCSCGRCILTGVNPFNAYTGNLHHEVRDLEVWGGVGEIPLVWRRYYNSRESQGWWGFSFQYTMINDGNNSLGQPLLTIWFPEGGGLTFAQSPTDPSRWLPTIGVEERLFQQGNNFFFQMSNGHRLRFQRIGTGSSAFYLLQDIRDSYQNIYRLAYNAENNLTRVTEPAGRYLEMTYSTVYGYKVITKVSTSDGRSVFYNYSVVSDGASDRLQLTTVNYGDGTRATYSYYEPFTRPWAPGAAFTLLAHAVDPRYEGSTVNMSFTYDNSIASGYIKEERNGKTGQVMATLNADENNRWICYANGRVQHLVMPVDLLGKTKEYIDGLGRKTIYEYDETTGFIKTITDPLGRITTYNARTIYSNPLEVTHPDGSKEKWTRDDLDLVLTYTDELGRTTTFSRDNRHRINKITYADGATEGLTYNNFGQVLAHTLRNGGIERNVYDNRGLKIRFRDAEGNVTRYAYDAADKLAAVTDARGNTIAYEYNERGLLTKLTNADNSAQSYTYDDYGNRTSVTNELGNTWKMAFDEFKRMVSNADPLNRQTQYSYDLPGGGCGCSHDNNSPTKIVLPSGRVTMISYDVEWQKTSQTVGADSADAATTFIEYDAEGNLVTIIDSRGNSSGFAYDSRNRKISATDPLGNKSETILDAVGNVLKQIRPDNSATVNVFDPMNRLTQTTDAKGQITRYRYNAMGNMVRLTDANNRNYNFEYDLLTRRIKMTFPGGTFERYLYDGVSNLIRYTNRSGDVRTYIYDNRNRQTRSDWSDNTPDVDRTYDLASRLLRLSSSVSVLRYSYDAANEMTSETQNILGGPGAKKVSYGYNNDGLRKEMTYPGGTVIDYDYTGRNQIKTITADASPLVAYTYDLNGNRINKTLVNGTNAFYVYDDANQMLSVDNRKGAVSFARFDYSYDIVNRRKFVRRNTDKYEVYKYDETDQVTRVQYEVNNPEDMSFDPAKTVGYNYDLLGNRITVSSFDFVIPYETNHLNQYIFIGGQPTPTYNTNGDLKTLDGWTYTFDAQDRLTKAEKGSTLVQFAYDGQNRRVSQVINGTATFLYYETWNLVEERNATDVLINRYLHGAQIDEILSKTSQTTEIVYYHHDALGSVTQLSNSLGNVVEQYSYDVFGVVSIKSVSNIPITSNAFRNRFLFTGREFIQEISLYDYRNRMYSTELGRFLQIDPIRFYAKDDNLYRYVTNNPINHKDPFGLQIIPLPRIISLPPLPRPFSLRFEPLPPLPFPEPWGPYPPTPYPWPLDPLEPLEQGPSCPRKYPPVPPDQDYYPHPAPTIPQILHELIPWIPLPEPKSLFNEDMTWA
ncbi:MAG: RHS repeat-associated core domain-containing protein [Ferruginibacter sp.]